MQGTWPFDSKSLICSLAVKRILLSLFADEKTEALEVDLSRIWKQHSTRTLNLISESKPTSLQISFLPCGIAAGMKSLFPFNEPSN